MTARPHAEVRDEPPALPDELWTARPLFRHIRSAAYARTVSAPALLAAVLVRAIAHTPPELVLPPIIGAEASLNMFVLCVAPSGLGKSVGHAYAGDLLDVTAAPELVERPLGSGEGLTEVFFDWVVEDDGSGKKVKVRRQVRRNALFFADEGTVLSELAARSGSTLMSQLRLAWSGQLLGQTNAAAERRRILDPHSYRLCLMMGIQPGNAAGLLADEASGTPQRFLWVSALDETVPDLERLPKWPGRLPWAVPKLPDGPVDVDRRIVTELRRKHVERHHGAPVAALDSHAGLVRLKVAAGFALLDRRHAVTVDDWGLAGTVMRYSDAVRTATVAAVRQRRTTGRRRPHRPGRAHPASARRRRRTPGARAGCPQRRPHRAPARRRARRTGRRMYPPMHHARRERQGPGTRRHRHRYRRDGRAGVARRARRPAVRREAAAVKAPECWNVGAVQHALSQSLRASPIVTKKVLVTALRRSGVFRTRSEPTLEFGPTFQHRGVS